jgi:hypothetical protein
VLRRVVKFSEMTALANLTSPAHVVLHSSPKRKDEYIAFTSIRDVRGATSPFRGYPVILYAGRMGPGRDIHA